MLGKWSYGELTVVHGWPVSAQLGWEVWWWSPAWFLVVDVGPMPLVTLVQGCWCIPCEPLLCLLQGWCVSREGSLHLGVGEGALETSCTPQH